MSDTLVEEMVPQLVAAVMTMPTLLLQSQQSTVSAFPTPQHYTERGVRGSPGISLHLAEPLLLLGRAWRLLGSRASALCPPLAGNIGVKLEPLNN